MPLPQLSQPRDCHRSMGEPRMSLFIRPPAAPLIQHWLGPCSLDGCQHGFPPPSPPPPGHFCRSPSPARRTQSSQSSCKSFPAAQGSAKLSLPPKFMEKQVPASDAQHNCEVEQAVLASCSRGSCSLSLPLPPAVTLGGLGTGTSLHRQSSPSTVCLPRVALPNPRPLGAPQTLGGSMRNSMDRHSRAQTPPCAAPSPLCPSVLAGA